MQIINPVSAAASQYFNGMTNVQSSLSTSAHATKGNWYTPRVNQKINRINTQLGNTGVANYQAQIASLDGSNNVVAVLGTSSAVAGNNAVTQYVSFLFATPVNLVAGTKYALVVTVLGGTGVTPCNIYTVGTNGFNGNSPGTYDNSFIFYDSIGLSAAQAASSVNGGNAAALWLEGTF